MDITRRNDGMPFMMPQEQMEYDRSHFAERVLYYIGCFMPEKDIMRKFGWTREEMDKACDQVFNHMTYADVYAYFFADVMMEGKQLIEELATGGNTSALKIFAEAILRLNKEEDEEKSRLTINIDV